MNAVFYSLALGGSEIAPAQLARSLETLRMFDRETRVFVFLFGPPPEGFIDVLVHFGAEVRQLGDYTAYVAGRQPDHGALFALDPKIHRWLVLDEPELKAFERLLYIDSDTMFFAPVRLLFERYRAADLYAREEPFSRRSPLGHDPAYLDEDRLAALRTAEGVAEVPPFNTGVCLLSRAMADAITAALPRYFDTLFRFLSWFHLHPVEQASAGNSSINALADPRFRPDTDRALDYPSNNRWIVDQVAMWLALGQYPELRFADFHRSDIWQGAEFQQGGQGRTLPIIAHYFSSNTARFFDWLQTLSADTPRQ